MRQTMNNKYYNIDQLKIEYIGKTFNWLTILDVVYNDNHQICFLCKCRCGKIKEVLKKYVLSNHTKSCGCYRSSKEKANKHSEWYKTHTDEFHNSLDKRNINYKDVGIKISNWYKDNPEKVKEKSEKYKQWCKNNPEKVADRGKKHSKYLRNNPDIIYSVIEKRNSLYKEHPEKLRSINEAISRWYKDNEDKVSDLRKNRSAYLKDHPQLIESISHKISEYKKIKRSECDYSFLIEIIHPNYIEDLLNFNLTSNSIIETKCPKCCEYDRHLLHNVFSIKTANYKKRSYEDALPPLCNNCKQSLITSQYEDEIAYYISTFYANDVFRNDRSILNGKELDLYYPEKRIAIEFNGDYWHSDKFKDKDYHLNKYLQCKEKGVLLVSVFESDWLSRKSEIQSYLQDLFNYVDNPLSFISDESRMNNNYPAPSNLNKVFYIEESFYEVDSNKIYTCGYSIIS